MKLHLLTVVKEHPLVTFFLLTFLITWAGQLPTAASSHGWLPFHLPPVVGLLATYGPALAALLTVGMTKGRAGLLQLLRHVIRWRVGIQWYLVVLGLPGILASAALAFALLLGGTFPDLAHAPLYQFSSPTTPLWQAALTALVFIALGPDGLGEELGWRGYALAHLQAGRSTLAACLLLTVPWALWHLPDFLTQGSSLSQVPLLFVGAFVLDIGAKAILYAWVYNNTGGSVLLTILFHAADNTTALFISESSDIRLYVMNVLMHSIVAILVVLLAGATRLSRSPIPVPGMLEATGAL